MRRMNAVLLDWRSKRTAHVRVATAFDKHLYLTSCLNAHTHNTCIRLPQTGCTARKIPHY